MDYNSIKSSLGGCERKTQGSLAEDEFKTEARNGRVTAKGKLERWSTTSFSECYRAWIHLKAMLIKPGRNEDRVRKTLNNIYSVLAAPGMEKVRRAYDGRRRGGRKVGPVSDWDGCRSQEGGSKDGCRRRRRRWRRRRRRRRRGEAGLANGLSRRMMMDLSQ
eukprot:747285-Hanusia_phi.AAC.1